MRPDGTVWNEPLVEQTVTYHIEIDGQLLLIENVPARVNVETGERYFAPETVERLQQAVWRQCRPVALFRLRSMSMPLCPESLGRLATPALAPSPLDTSPQGAPPFFEPRHVQIHS